MIESSKPLLDTRTVAPGQTGVLTQKVSGVPKTYPFEVHAEEAGSLVDVVYAVTQSTT